MQLRQFRALSAVALAAVLLGTTGTASSLGPPSLRPEIAAAWRTVIGGAGLLAASVVAGCPPWHYRLRLLWMVVGAVGISANQLAFFAAIERTGVAVGTLVTVGTVPLVAGALDWLTGKQPPRPKWGAGVLIAVTGVAFLSGSTSGADVTGASYAALAGASAAVFGFAAKSLMGAGPVLPAMAAVVGGGAVLLAPLAIAHAAVAFGSVDATLTVAFLGLVTMAAAYWLWGAGLHRLSLGIVAAVTLLEPAVAAMLATTVLDEPVNSTSLVGIGLILAGVAVASNQPSTAGAPPP